LAALFGELEIELAPPGRRPMAPRGAEVLGERRGEVLGDVVTRACCERQKTVRFRWGSKQVSASVPLARRDGAMCERCAFDASSRTLRLILVLTNK
jgi:hypothetical protein